MLQKLKLFNWLQRSSFLLLAPLIAGSTLFFANFETRGEGGGTVISLGSSASATQVPTFTLSQLTQFADVIVIATVTDVQPKRGPQYVVTDTTMHVESVLKGDVGSSIILHQRGGQVGDFATLVFGMPQYQVGERVLVFLEAKKTGRFVTAGFWQGKHTILTQKGIDYVKMAPLFVRSNSSPTPTGIDPHPTHDTHLHPHSMIPIQTKPNVTYDQTGLADQLYPLAKLKAKIEQIVAQQKSTEINKLQRSSN